MQRPHWISQAQIDLQDGNVEVFWLDLAQPAAIVESAIEQLPMAEVEKIQQLLRPVSRRNRSLCQAGLRWLLADNLGIAPEQLQFQHSLNGKPSLKSQPLHFSLSHSRDLGVVALSRCRPIGVDVEFMDLSRDFLRFAKNFFSAAEQADLLGRQLSAGAAKFYALWTAKEAAIKAADADLATGLREMADRQFRSTVALCPLAAPAGYAAALAELGFSVA